MRRHLLSLALFLGSGLAQLPANLPKADLLWPGGAPESQGIEDIDQPSLAPYLVPSGRGTGTAVIVCPGGLRVGLRQVSMIMYSRPSKKSLPDGQTGYSQPIPKAGIGGSPRFARQSYDFDQDVVVTGNSPTDTQSSVGCHAR